jgi:hypothetical protein
MREIGAGSITTTGVFNTPQSQSFTGPPMPITTGIAAAISVKKSTMRHHEPRIKERRRSAMIDQIAVAFRLRAVLQDVDDTTLTKAEIQGLTTLTRWANRQVRLADAPDPQEAAPLDPSGFETRGDN